MAEAQFPLSKLRKLAELPDRLNGVAANARDGATQQLAYSGDDAAEAGGSAAAVALEASVAE